MTKTIHYCDRCGEEVKRVVEFPKMLRKGITVVWNDFDKVELCETCADRLINYYNNPDNTREDTDR